MWKKLLHSSHVNLIKSSRTCSAAHSPTISPFNAETSIGQQILSTAQEEKQRARRSFAIEFAFHVTRLTMALSVAPTVYLLVTAWWDQLKLNRQWPFVDQTRSSSRN